MVGDAKRDELNCYVRCRYALVRVTALCSHAMHLHISLMSPMALYHLSLATVPITPSSYHASLLQPQDLCSHVSAIACAYTAIDASMRWQECVRTLCVAYVVLVWVANHERCRIRQAQPATPRGTPEERRVKFLFLTR